MRRYIAIDLKSFYASSECMERGLDPMTTFLVVADPTRTSKTICLAVSPALKALGVSGRPRLFEVEQQVKIINGRRRAALKGKPFSGTTIQCGEFQKDLTKGVDFVIAPPQMAHYIAVSTKIYEIYLRYVAPEDIHVYSIDEVFIDATPYLETYKLSAHDFAMKLILEVLKETGITATAGIGTNLYLAKIAMDVEAKHIEADENGVRIAELDVRTYREKLWTHTPITDFWRVGKGYGRRLETYGIRTMGDVARCSIMNEELLYRLFGVNAELLIDHAWGEEPCTIAEIKAYKPDSRSVGAGQVLQEAYTFEKALLVAKEMADSLALDLVDKRLESPQLVLTVGYDIENLTNPRIRSLYKGAVQMDNYGRQVPKSSHGTANLEFATASSKIFMETIEDLFCRLVDPNLLVRRINLAACKVQPVGQAVRPAVAPLDLFGAEESGKPAGRDEETLSKEKKLQEVMLSIKNRYGKNAIVRGMNVEEGATGFLRNQQIGGHKA